MILFALLLLLLINGQLFFLYVGMPPLFSSAVVLFRLLSDPFIELGVLLDKTTPRDPTKLNHFLKYFLQKLKKEKQNKNV